MINLCSAAANFPLFNQEFFGQEQRTCETLCDLPANVQEQKVKTNFRLANHQRSQITQGEDCFRRSFKASHKLFEIPLSHRNMRMAAKYFYSNVYNKSKIAWKILETCCVDLVKSYFYLYRKRISPVALM